MTQTFAIMTPNGPMLKDMDAVDEDSTRQHYNEALIGGQLYREAFVAGRGQYEGKLTHGGYDKPELDAWIGYEALAITEGTAYRVLAYAKTDGGEYQYQAYPRARRVSLELAEAMTGWPIIRAAILQQALEPILYHDGPDTEWSSDEIENVARLIARPAARRCPECGHTMIEKHDPDETCFDCDELAETGQYAPCQDPVIERVARLARIAEVYPAAAAEARAIG